MLKRIKTNYKKIILDFIPAFLGVLVALILSNWNEQRKENEFIEKSIVSIYNDNKENLDRVNFQITHLKNHVDTFNFYQNDTINIMDLIVKNKGLTTKMYIQTGWNILENSQLVTKIDYELLTLLTNNSKSIELWSSYQNRISNLLYNNLENKNSIEKKRMIILLKDAGNASKNFLDNLQEIDSVLTTKYEDILEIENN